MHGEGLYQYAVAQADGTPNNNPDDPTQRLAELKAGLEADPRPRYVVVKAGMDHGPFSAVELLQQLASGTFIQENVLRDTFAGEERLIKDWEEFAPFAEQAKLNRDIIKEKKQLEAVVVAEKKGTQYKALIGAAIIGVVAAGGAGLWLRDRVSRDPPQKSREQGRLSRRQRRTRCLQEGLVRRGPGAFGPGGRPILPGGMSCEAAKSKYIEDYDKSAPPLISARASSVRYSTTGRT